MSKPPSDVKNENLPLIETLYSLIDSTSRLERAWSNALEKDEIKIAHSELVTLWESFTRNITSRMKEQSLDLERLGFDTKINRFPPSDAELQDWSIKLKTPIERYNRYSIAFFYQLKDLLEVINDFKNPSAKETVFPSGITESWWDAGAWSNLRSCAQSMAFTLEQQTVVFEEITKPSHKTISRPTSYQYFDTLNRLLNFAQYEAVPGVLVGSINLIVLEKTGLKKLPSDFAVRLSKVGRYKVLSALYPKLQDASKRIAKGEILGRDYLVPLVTGAVTHFGKFGTEPIAPELIAELKK